MGGKNSERKYPKVQAETLKAALVYYDQCKNQRKTCRKFGLTRSVFQKYMKWNIEDIPEELSQGRHPVFTKEQEQELVSYVISLANRFYGMTRRAIGDFAYTLAERNGIMHPFQNRSASEDWICGFLRRHSNILSFRDGEPLSLARITRFNKIEATRFFDLLEEIVVAKGFNENTIFNVDETGFSLVPNRMPRRIARKGSRHVYVMMPAERGALCTVTCCCNANGYFVPPFFIFPQNAGRIEPDNPPQGSEYIRTSRGWSTTESFIKWLKHFRRHATRNPGTHVLLILDNHGSHISYDVVKYCRKNAIELLTLPPHSSHKMQPLDVGVYSPLKAKYREELARWLSSHMRQAPKIVDIPDILAPAYKEATKRSSAVNGFRATGIWEVNPETGVGFPNRNVMDGFFEKENEETSEDESDDSSDNESDNSQGPENPPRRGQLQRSDDLHDGDNISTAEDHSQGVNSNFSGEDHSQGVNSNFSDHSQGVNSNFAGEDHSQGVNSNFSGEDHSQGANSNFDGEDHSQGVNSNILCQHESQEVNNFLPGEDQLHSLGYFNFSREEISSKASSSSDEYDLVDGSSLSTGFKDKGQTFSNTVNKTRNVTLVPYSDSSCEEDTIYQEQAYSLQGPSGSSSFGSTIKTRASAFNVTPWDIENENQKSQTITPTRKQREVLHSEVITSDENLTKLRLGQKKKKVSSDSGERPTTRSASKASRLTLRSGKAVMDKTK
ncbi:unnamed protein product [Allacma fusca]|uniref:HTH CENPB-type domain-containing protein n=1 Tax=Allacma fusca TaxID=39272 RepID=A0A8J2JM74_9HEXA|nr:unnamed protein product [Allacma fusca]